MSNKIDIVDRLRRNIVNQKNQMDAAEEIERLRERVRDLEQRIGNASILMADWDGYYNPETKKGNAVELANLIYESYTILQGRGWNEKAEADAQNEHFRTNHK
jgi:hypothetical protein